MRLFGLIKFAETVNYNLSTSVSRSKDASNRIQKLQPMLSSPYKSRDQVPLQKETTLQQTTVPGPPQMCTSLQWYVAAYTNIDRSAIKTNHGKSVSKS